MQSIEQWPISQPIPYARNARKIPEKAVEKVASSIAEFGFQQPLVVDKNGVIIVGHTRLLAAKKLGFETVPVHVAADLTEGQVKAYRLMDNRSHEEASWDFDLIAAELCDLQAFAVDLSLTGFDAAELKDLMEQEPTAGLTDEDAAPEVPEDPTSVRGDVWLLGEHRLLCGDATVSADVNLLLNGVAPVLMTTDPPYGVEYDPEWRAAAGVNNNRSKLGTVRNDNRADWREAWALYPGDVLYVWHAGKFAATVQLSIESCGFEIRNQIIWAKERFALSRGNYHWQHEPCWYAVRNNAHWNGDRSQSTLWQISSREDSGHGHGTQKPVECMRRPMLNNSSAGQVVYDPFLGSGTSIIAAETIGRRCFGLEIDPAYCDAIVKRWQQFTGKAAVLESTGQAFVKVAESRKAVSD